MSINWGALGVVAVVSLAVGVLVVVLVSLALVGLSAREPRPTISPVDEPPSVGPGNRLSPAAGTATAVVCLLAAAAIVLYGFYVLIF
jgi:hypothetical protein